MPRTLLYILCPLTLLSASVGCGAAPDEQELRSEFTWLVPNQPEAVTAFLRDHPRLSADTLHHTLASAVADGDLATVRLLLLAGAPVDGFGTGSHNVAPLEDAAGNGDLPMVKLLLGAGARINRRDVHGWTAFFSAAMHEQLEVLQYLARQRGCRHCLRNSAGNTALQLSVQWRRVASVRYLVEHSRIDRQAKNDEGLTALQIARQSLEHAPAEETEEWREIVRLLQP